MVHGYTSYKYFSNFNEIVSNTIAAVKRVFDIICIALITI